MAGNEPTIKLDPSFSSEGATPTSWSEATEQLEKAEVYWLSTVRPDGRPHVTPLVAVWLDGALYFSIGETERKAKNLAQNARCVLATGCNALGEGLDVVIEGEAVRVSDPAKLQRLAEQYASKYPPIFHYAAGDGGFRGTDSSFAPADGGNIPVYEVAPTTAFGFRKGETFSQTRWRF